MTKSKGKKKQVTILLLTKETRQVLTHSNIVDKLLCKEGGLPLIKDYC